MKHHVCFSMLVLLCNKLLLLFDETILSYPVLYWNWSWWCDKAFSNTRCSDHGTILWWITVVHYPALTSLTLNQWRNTKYTLNGVQKGCFVGPCSYLWLNVPYLRTLSYLVRALHVLAYCRNSHEFPLLLWVAGYCSDMGGIDILKNRNRMLKIWVPCFLYVGNYGTPYRVWPIFYVTKAFLFS